MPRPFEIELYKSEGAIEPFTRLALQCAFLPEVVVWGKVAFQRREHTFNAYYRVNTHVIDLPAEIVEGMLK